MILNNTDRGRERKKDICVSLTLPDDLGQHCRFKFHRKFGRNL